MCVDHVRFSPVSGCVFLKGSRVWVCVLERPCKLERSYKLERSCKLEKPYKLEKVSKLEEPL